MENEKRVVVQFSLGDENIRMGMFLVEGETSQEMDINKLDPSKAVQIFNALGSICHQFHEKYETLIPKEDIKS